MTIAAADLGPTALTDDVRWNLLQARTNEIRARRAFELLRAEGIEPILIKGIAAGQWYPHLKPRVSVDTDIAVAAVDFAKAERVIGSAAADGLAIDLHRELRHLDSLTWEDLIANSVSLEADGASIRILRPEDHLRVLCVHWLTDGGSDKHRLWDIYYAIDNRPSDFDWHRFLDVVSPTRRRWLECTVGMAARYLGLDLRNTPLDGAELRIPSWFIKTAESEWQSAQVRPLDTVITDRAALWTQIRKRLRPNPIWATVQVEGSFDAKNRLIYQLRSFAMRTAPSIRRITATLRRRNGHS